MATLRRALLVVGLMLVLMAVSTSAPASEAEELPWSPAGCSEGVTTSDIEGTWHHGSLECGGLPRNCGPIEM